MVGTINTYLPFPHIIFACLVLNILSGCVVFPASHQITPEITGMIKIDDKPVAGARIIESFTSNVEGRMRDYPDRVVHTDSEGKFYLKERRFNTIVTFIGDWYNLTKLFYDT